MIGSFILFAVMFAAASLGWGFVFHSEKSGLGRKALVLAYFLVAACSVFASVFFLKGLAEAGHEVTLVTSSMVFALAFVLTLFIGGGVAASKRMAALFSKGEEMWRGENQEKDRSDVVDEILSRISETGKIDAFESQMIESILKFSDKIVREVMIPRGDIVAINIEEEPRSVLRKVAEEGYSRMPVFSGSIDNILGIIYAKDLITMAEGSGAIVLQDLLRAPYYVPESKKISQLLREMQRNKVHLAVVVDEFGGTEGVVTLEDVLEEIVGEIQDEYDESLSELIRDDNGDVHFSGSMTVDRFDELLECEIPREEGYDTMAGFVQKLAGKLPQKGEVYSHEEMYFIIEDVARHRIKRLRVSFKEHPKLGDESGPAPVAQSSNGFPGLDSETPVVGISDKARAGKEGPAETRPRPRRKSPSSRKPNGKARPARRGRKKQ